MTITMRRESMNVMATARGALGLVTGAMMAATVASAQTQQTGQSRWRIGALTGGYVPRSSLIIAADSDNTRLGAGPAFSLDLQYLASKSVSAYASGMLAFGTITLGSSIRPSVNGPSNQVMLTGGTAGVLLTGAGWLGDHFQPTLRLGGGFKWYRFDLAGTQNQVRLTGDIGLGFRGVGSGPIEVTAEVRYLPSSFDQGKLPTQGIAPQNQRQNDLVFVVGVGIRP
jgi:hypothetical protein